MNPIDEGTTKFRWVNSTPVGRCEWRSRGLWPGVWLVRTVTIVPDNEHWLQAPAAVADLEQALAWAANNPADDTNLDQLLVKLADD